MASSPAAASPTTSTSGYVAKICRRTLRTKHSSSTSKMRIAAIVLTSKYQWELSRRNVTYMAVISPVKSNGYIRLRSCKPPPTQSKLTEHGHFKGKSTEHVAHHRIPRIGLFLLFFVRPVAFD